MREVLERCEALRAETGGYFDARVGGLDPSGLVKGWAVDRAVRLLEAAGARDLCVNAGGDVVRARRNLACRDPPSVRAPQPGRGADPRRRGRGRDVRRLRARDAHPRPAHRPPGPGALSVTIVGQELATADAYATAAFAMGEAGPAWTAGLEGHDAMTILPGGRVLSTPGLLRHCAGGSVAGSLA